MVFAYIVDGSVALSLPVDILADVKDSVDELELSTAVLLPVFKLTNVETLGSFKFAVAFETVFLVEVSIVVKFQSEFIDPGESTVLFMSLLVGSGELVLFGFVLFSSFSVDGSILETAFIYKIAIFIGAIS